VWFDPCSLRFVVSRCINYNTSVTLIKVILILEQVTFTFPASVIYFPASVIYFPASSFPTSVIYFSASVIYFPASVIYFPASVIYFLQVDLLSCNHVIYLI
jgi:hypothetical protein